MIHTYSTQAKAKYAYIDMEITNHIFPVSSVYINNTSDERSSKLSVSRFATIRDLCQLVVEMEGCRRGHLFPKLQNQHETSFKDMQREMDRSHLFQMEKNDDGYYVLTMNLPENKVFREFASKIKSGLIPEEWVVIHERFCATPARITAQDMADYQREEEIETKVREQMVIFDTDGSKKRKARDDYKTKERKKICRSIAKECYSLDDDMIDDVSHHDPMENLGWWRIYRINADDTVTVAQNGYFKKIPWRFLRPVTMYNRMLLKN